VERKQADHLIVVTVPKSGSVKPQIRTEDKPQALPADSRKPFFYSDQDIMEGMDRMRREMDRIFDDSFRDFRIMPDFKGFFDEHRFGSTYDLEEKDGNYVVRVYLPDRDMNNVNVNVEADGRTLSIEARAENTASSSDKNKESTVKHAAYTQRITLPGPVNAVKMKVDRKDRMLVVTLPKGETL
jgi:HSP20 family molecular chaperone IbpA